MVAKRSCRSTRTATFNQLRHLGFCAPDEVRQRFPGLSDLRLAEEAASLRPREGTVLVAFATKTAMRTLGRRVAVLDREKADLDELLEVLVASAAPELFALYGVGVHTAATLLVAAGDNPPSACAASGVGPSVRRGAARGVVGQGGATPACQMVGAACFLTGIIDPAETLRRLATPVHVPGKKRRVSAVSINPTYLALLVQEAPRLGYGAGDFGLERIFCGGEILTAALRRRAEETFGAAITDNYAMTETFPLAGLVCAEGHLHVAADQGLVEVLHPETFAPTAPGEVGTLVVTPYPPYRETMPLLRLATGDLVRRLAEVPSCELAGLPATSPLLGRAALCSDGGGRPLYQRDVLELLEGEPALPMPCRYAVAPVAGGFEVHVLAAGEDEAVRHRLEHTAAARRLPVARVRLHTTSSTMPKPEFARALLHETVAVRDEGSGTWSLR